MIVELYGDWICVRISSIDPGDEAVTVGTHRVAHEAVFEEVAIPLLALLFDDAGFDLFDERAEEGLAHLGRERVGGPLAEGGVGELGEGDFVVGLAGSSSSGAKLRPSMWPGLGRPARSQRVG